MALRLDIMVGVDFILEIHDAYHVFELNTIDYHVLCVQKHIQKQYMEMRNVSPFPAMRI